MRESERLAGTGSFLETAIVGRDDQFLRVSPPPCRRDSIYATGRSKPVARVGDDAVRFHAELLVRRRPRAPVRSTTRRLKRARIAQHAGCVVALPFYPLCTATSD